MRPIASCYRSDPGIILLIHHSGELLVMTRSRVLLLVWASLFIYANRVTAQNKTLAEAVPETAGSSASKTSKPAEILPTAPVITIKGLCGDGKSNRENCQTIITREQFESLVGRVQPGIPAREQVQFASYYPRILAMADEAKKRGLDKEPNYLENLRYLQAQALNQELMRKLQEDAANISKQDVENYYKQHPELYETAIVDRVFIPKKKMVSTKDTGSPGDGGEAAMTQEAKDLRAKAVAGESFVKLQKEAFVFGGYTATPPDTLSPPIPHGGMPEGHESVFNLKPGEVSQLITDENGIYFYKLVSKSMMPLDQVEAQIRKTVENERIGAVRKQIEGGISTELNQAYFVGKPGVDPGR